ncbi:hypothetical protein [Kitasatospora sp. NPDC050467]|uniref:hypothetical protein n=1 Tax=unclassified Kitasatospora TaxID=2633591 RepID=UPI0032436857
MKGRRARREAGTPCTGATHLFEEPGAIEEAAGLATSWFTDHLKPDLQPAG